MSHFTVLVVGNDYEKQLAPYQENNMGDCPEEYLEFNVTHKKEDFDKDAQELKDKYPDIVEWKDKTSLEILQDWGGGQLNENGDLGYIENPNAKWDWYQMGGRWAGFFKLKPGVTVASRGQQSWMQKMDGRAYPEGAADQAYKGDIDFEGMRNEDGQKAAEIYDKAQAIIAGRSVESWEEILAKHGTENIEAARKEYHGQPVKVDLDKAYLLGWSGSPNDYLVPREEFIQKARDGAIGTHAVIKDGKWYERGEMGWFACVSNEKDENQWNREYQKLLDEIPDDTLLTVVDCHI